MQKDCTAKRVVKQNGNNKRTHTTEMLNAIMATTTASKWKRCGKLSYRLMTIDSINEWPDDTTETRNKININTTHQCRK